jgi:hypothetical protein
MHDIEPYYNWRDYYIASEDYKSPFYGREYSEFEFSHAVYNHVIHPQWDAFGSQTLYLKLLYANYENRFCIVEFIGEWNDLLHNDIMFLKRNFLEPLMDEGIYKFILIGENVLNFHYAEDDYYQEWFDEVEEGWIAGINFRDHVIKEFAKANIDYYISFGGDLDELSWRTLTPLQLYHKINTIMNHRLTP